VAAVRGEKALLAAIHSWSFARAPRLRFLMPAHAGPGEVVIFRGEGLDGGDLKVHFGDAETWAASLSPRSAVAMVPADAQGPAPVSVSRHGLRSNSLSWGGPPGDQPARVLRIDPADGATGVFRDSPVVATLSHPAAPETVGEGALVVSCDDEVIPGWVSLSPDGRLVVWQPADELTPGVVHAVRCAGIRDGRGREMVPCESRFVPCGLAWSDVPG
jgi:hypothetical protein